ncbi:bifunctional riboflavin kinase/FAD synthetase [Blastomonas fulva]|uniref:bifunctional riboflavin kinase/FAD synthetase n=1 Tax=Blastomonas fulva TaxID=1550728 RepID=UPI0025A45A96|nr:bifunctional riboflavin kinase/FAD synthetase [Blastomonas fulva]MDM7928202.1 bifunctional riboflavin kinase/FAD synthetase [Blastomonas fulva]MDM7965128.1 bifunctional riboflavin kinase/FAD synthetase [Blastomonas fulva]
MIRVEGGDQLPERLRGGIIALGNFDGFHAGHQAVVGRAIAWAKAESRPAIVATFDPHPVRYFKPDVAPFRLTSLDQRQKLFAEAGADAMLVFAFDETLANTTAGNFVGDLLVTRFGAKGVVTGEDFTFGKGRGGNIEVLRDLGALLGLRSEAVGPVSTEDAVISSSRIRQCLIEGKPDEAERLMTRPFAVQGVVQHGDKNGRLLGYPTANVDMGSYLRPMYGVYAVTGHLADGRVLNGAANLGIRPQFDPPKELLEPHFFDFDEDLYGQTIEVALRHFIRPEAKFASMEELTAQIEADCVRARELLA